MVEFCCGIGPCAVVGFVAVLGGGVTVGTDEAVGVVSCKLPTALEVLSAAPRLAEPLLTLFGFVLRKNSVLLTICGSKDMPSPKSRLVNVMVFGCQGILAGLVCRVCCCQMSLCNVPLVSCHSSDQRISLPSWVAVGEVRICPLDTVAISVVCSLSCAVAGRWMDSKREVPC